MNNWGTYYLGQSRYNYVKANQRMEVNMRPSEILKIKRREIREVFNKYQQVTNPRVFGSVARGEDTDSSDLDILIDYPKGMNLFTLGGLQDELEQVLPNVKIDLINSRRVQAEDLAYIEKTAFRL